MASTASSMSKFRMQARPQPARVRPGLGPGQGQVVGLCEARVRPGQG
jgi:hypothetical protein